MIPIALVVADRSRQPDDLDAALVESGFSVRHADPAELTRRPELLQEPEVVLASARLGLQRVALLGQRFAATARPPVLLVFPDGDLDLLEACVRGGFDYVTPPFRPGLLRSRISPRGERGELAGAVGEMAVEASLRAYERELRIARDIQSGFLPAELPHRGGWEATVRFRPAREVAGDFYDGFELVGGRRLGFVVADVCDKGVSAALFMALIRTLIRHTAEQAGSWRLMEELPHLATAGDDATAVVAPPQLSVGAGPLVQAVVGTNRYLTRNHLRQGYFVTLVFAVLDPSSGSLLYINGGHNPPVLVRRDGQQVFLPPTGPAVGMLADGTYTLGHVVLQPGDLVLFYTDGVVEARDGHGEMFGVDRLLEVLQRHAPSAEATLVAVDRALEHHVGLTDQFDDITMLALRRSG